MIGEEFFPTSVYGKDVQLNNQELAQHIINWSQQDKGIKKNRLKLLQLLRKTYENYLNFPSIESL